MGGGVDLVSEEVAGLQKANTQSGDGRKSCFLEESTVAWPSLAWPGLAWPGLVWSGLAWCGLA